MQNGTAQTGRLSQSIGVKLLESYIPFDDLLMLIIVRMILQNSEGTSLNMLFKNTLTSCFTLGRETT